MRHPSTQDIIDFWGRDKLKRWPEQVVDQTALSADAKRFLVEVGFPVGEDWYFEFDKASDDLPVLQAGRPPRPCRVIGTYDTVPICAEETRRGWVVAVGDRELFVNTDVVRFGLSLLVYGTYRQTVATLDDQRAGELIDDVEQTLRQIDRDAFDDSENHWPLIVEQMRDGML